MSYSNVFHDYIQDIPMNIGRKFYPTSNIVVEEVLLPKSLIFADLKYNFDAENRAREQFDKQNESLTPTQVSTISPTETTSTEDLIPKRHILSQEVLVPCPVAPRTTSLPTTKKVSSEQNTPHNAHFLQDFEHQNSVFDDIEIMALDEKKMLQEVLMSTSSNSSSPSLANTPQTTANLENNNKVNLDPVQNKKDEELKKRLLSKGYRPDIVETCSSKLPRNRFVHIEYYMKACRTIEKTKAASVDDTINFLIHCNLIDKQVILNYSESCAHLLNMGFPKDQVFDAVAKNNGDRNGALNILLPSA